MTSSRKDVVCTPWTYEDDTAMREPMIPGEIRAAFYARVLPHRTLYSCQSHYRHVVGPLLGDPQRKYKRTRFETHVLLARNEFEIQNLLTYYGVRLTYTKPAVREREEEAAAVPTPVSVSVLGAE